MKERFKFRVWDKISKKMATPHAIIEESPAFFTLEHGYIIPKPDDIVLMQCSGLKDKTGKLIYEGDIVNYESAETNLLSVIIEWQSYEAAFWLKDKNGICSSICDCADFELLGNIYQNPELIKK